MNSARQAMLVECNMHASCISHEEQEDVQDSSEAITLGHTDSADAESEKLGPR